MRNCPQGNLPFVSIIIPCRNEEKYIGKCLDTILEQDYPKENLEVLVVDGMSEDKTREIVRNYSEKYPFVKLLENPKKFTNFALNIGIKVARGEIIMMMGAHAGYERDYVSKCVKYLKEYDADNVGGVMKTLPGKNTIFAKAIAITLSHFFGTGGSYFRTGLAKPRWVDTVFGGCYRREVFNKIGLFNENLLRSQDMEFNLRLKKAGGKILLAPDIISYYYPKSNLKDFFVHNFEDGVWITYPLKFRIKAFCWRHLMPLIFVSSLIGTIILGTFTPIFFWLFLTIIVMYLLTNIYFSMKIAAKQKDIRYLFLIPVAFATRHIGYGLGSVWGLIKLII